jgi:hypothetical protein
MKSFFWGKMPFTSFLVLIISENSYTLKKLKTKNPGQVPVAHVCNPSYSGGRHQEDCGSKSAWVNSL